jgi:hypothetical protein
MTSAAVTLAIAAFLSGAVSAVFVMLVACIQAGDRARRLTAAPRNRLETLTRTVLGVGIRTGHPPATKTAERTDDARCRTSSQPANIWYRKCRDCHRQCCHGISPAPSSNSRLPPQRNGHAMTTVMRWTSPGGLAIIPEAIP